MIQILSGIQITPRGNNNRFVAQNWPRSYAFGGWVYNASVSQNFTEKPTEVKISAVLQTSSFSQSQAIFNINQGDLHCDAGVGGLSNETWYDINLDGYNLSHFLLYSYETSIENSQKILNVTFKDYSMILDKIYVGLFKKQGYLYPHSVSSILELPVRCQDCEYSGAAYTGTGYALRDIGFGCYIGTNGNTYDFFSNSFYEQDSVFDQWQTNIINNTSKVAQFDLNGGYLMLGTEAATEERCNSAPNINYSFTELICALRKGGLNLIGSFPSGTGDSDYVYRNTHNGSLREVLQNWCSDLAYTFYTSGRSFVGINLQNPINISGITTIADPDSSLGQYFQINDSTINGGGNSAILSFNSKASLENTFNQAVVVDNSYPITQKNVSKTVKKYAGATPMHPISLNQIDLTAIIDYNAYGTLFARPRYETNVFDTNNYNQSYWANFARLDGRSYSDVDAAIALTRFNPALRDIFVAQRALNNVSQFTDQFSDNNGSPVLDPLTNAYCVANFTALGFFPITEITGANFKTEIILDNFKNIERDNVSNLNVDQQYFRVFLGYYYEDLKSQIVDWEKAAGDAMYKYGVVTEGVLTGFPYISPNILADISPTAGFYGQNGLIYQRVNNTFIPDTERYPDIKYTPFAEALLYSGYVSSNSKGVYYDNSNAFNPYIPPGYSDYAGRLPTGLWVATLDNDWGTESAEIFNRSLAFVLNDPCAENYPITESVQNIQTSSDQSLQDWKIEYFTPTTPSPDLSKISDLITSDEYSFSGIVDEVLTTYTNLHLINKQECKKLHVIVIPDTINHPNVNISFTPRSINAINPIALRAYRKRLYDADLRKNTTETPSICSISLLDEMCRNITTGNFGIIGGQGDTIFQAQFNPPLSNQQTGCVILEDKNNYMLEGFPSGILFQPNSRTLDISITKNPNVAPYPTFDENGDFYYSDLNLGSLIINTATINTSIIYPLQCFPNGVANYNVIYQSDIETEYRIPAFATVYGTPVNITGNNTASFKLVSNTVDSLLDPILDPLTNEVKSYITVLDGSGQSIIQTPDAYYSYVKNLNNYSLLTPTKEVTMSLAGPPSQFGNFSQCLTPSSGLQSLTLSVSDNGVKTDLVFADRPKVLPKQESILNKIGPRIKGVYN